MSNHRKSDDICIWDHELWPCRYAKFAHELAEEIRAANNAEREAVGSYMFASEAADLIDPEVGNA